jgi:hypothetical protein
MHCQQGGEVWAWNGLLDAFRRFSSGFEPFLGSGVHRSDRSRSPVWPVRVLFLWWPVWPMWVEVVAAALFSSGLHAFVQGELACVQGVAFRALFRWFALFAWALFCLGCVESFPLPKGSETCLLQVILLFAFVWNPSSFAFLFSLPIFLGFP